VPVQGCTLPYDGYSAILGSLKYNMAFKSTKLYKDKSTFKVAQISYNYGGRNTEIRREFGEFGSSKL
jgi:hypothetical protein